MKVLDVLEMSKGRKKGQRRIDLFRREKVGNLDSDLSAWRCAALAQSSVRSDLLCPHRQGHHEGAQRNP